MTKYNDKEIGSAIAELILLQHYLWEHPEQNVQEAIKQRIKTLTKQSNMNNLERLKLHNEANNSNAIVTISNLCIQIAEKEVKVIIEEEGIDIDDIDNISDLEEFCDINMLGLTDELCKNLNFEAIKTIVKRVHAHINTEVITK